MSLQEDSVELEETYRNEVYGKGGYADASNVMHAAVLCCHAGYQLHAQHPCSSNAPLTPVPAPARARCRLTQQKKHRTASQHTTLYRSQTRKLKPLSSSIRHTRLPNPLRNKNNHDTKKQYRVEDGKHVERRAGTRLVE